MKRILFILAISASVTAASAQTKKPAAKTAETKKESCKKEGASCCSPSSKAKAILHAKPEAEKKS